MKSWHWVLGAALCLIVVVGLWLARESNATAGSTVTASDSLALPPLPHTVQVEVLNASGIANLARVATVRLRAGGLDVVYFGGGEKGQVKDGMTRVLVRGTDTTGLGRILDVLQTKSVEYQPDPARLVDFSVWLGGPLPPPAPSKVTPP